jgi:hypothetical protein
LTVTNAKEKSNVKPQKFKVSREELETGEVRRAVFPRPDAHSHVYQHPTEKWWVFGDNSGRTYITPVLKLPSGVEADEPSIEDGPYPTWVWKVRKVVSVIG